MILNKTKAFSLAEILIALVIIGLVAVVVLPSLKGDVNEKLLDSQKKTFYSKLNEGLHRMQSNGELAKEYESTEQFVDTMKKYFNLSKVCDKNKLSGCFGEKIKASKTSTLYNTNNISTSADVGIDFQTPSNLAGLVFSDGSRAIIAYDIECSVANIYDQTADVTECIAMYYDVNGNAGRGIIGEDIEELNVKRNNVEDIEIGEVFGCDQTKGLKPEQCQMAQREGAPIKECNEELTYDCWAYATYRCFREGKRLPTLEEFTAIANKLYDYPIGLSGAHSVPYGFVDEELKTKLKLIDGRNGFYYNKEISSTSAGYYNMWNTRAVPDAQNRKASISSFCVED